MAYYLETRMTIDCGNTVTRLARILLLVGLLVAGMVLLMLGVGERPITQDNNTGPMGSQRTGRSTVSHGGLGAGFLPDHSERLSAGGRDEVSKQSPTATTR